MYRPDVARLEIRQAEDGADEDDDALEDLADGLDSATVLVLRGHQVAALAWIARSPEPASAAREVASALLARMRRRNAGAIARSLLPIDIVDPAFVARLEAIADELRAKAAGLPEARLVDVIGAAAAHRLRTARDAWIVTAPLPPDELTRLAAHVAAGGELWGGLGDGRSFLRRPLLRSELDPGTEPAFEVAIAEVPPLRARGTPVRVVSRADPDEVAGYLTLRLVRDGALMICHAVDSNREIVDETGALQVDLGTAT